VEHPSWVPAGLDLDRPSASRVYDYLLGGAHNFQADRDLAAQILELAPEAAEAAQANRGFLRRAVSFLVAAGIRQFLDLGSGIPTRGNVHEIARQSAPDSHVVYVDVDPVAVAHGRQLLAGLPHCAAVAGDLREPERVLADPTVRELVDLGRPVAVLLVAVLHFVRDTDDPAGIVGRLREAMAPGSYLVLSHASFPPDVNPAAMRASQEYERTATPLVLRTRAEIGALLDGFELVEPGLVTVARWRPESESVAARTDRLPAYAAVGRKR
jgi:hypothetical protein